MVENIMKNRLANIEERYAQHLAKAGVFENGNKRPEPIKKKEKGEHEDLSLIHI